jgi:hypothetical protein
MTRPPYTEHGVTSENKLTFSFAALRNSDLEKASEIQLYPVTDVLVSSFKSLITRKISGKVRVVAKHWAFAPQFYTLHGTCKLKYIADRCQCIWLLPLLGATAGLVISLRPPALLSTRHYTIRTRRDFRKLSRLEFSFECVSTLVLLKNRTDHDCAVMLMGRVLPQLRTAALAGLYNSDGLCSLWGVSLGRKDYS